MANGRHPDVVDLRIRAPGAAAGDRDLVLARQVVEVRIAVQHPRGGLHERRGVHQLVGVHAGDRAPRDVARHVAARAHRREPGSREVLQEIGQVLDRHPVELEVLADGDVGHAACAALREARDRPELVGEELAVRDADPHHEVGYGLALAALAADGADAVALRVGAPPAEVRVEPRRGDRLIPFAGEAPDLGDRLPGIRRVLQSLGALGLRLLGSRRRRGRRCRDLGAAHPVAEDLGDLGPRELRRHQLAAPEQLTHHRAAQRHAVLRRVWAGLGRGDGLAAAAVEGLVEEEGRDP